MTKRKMTFLDAVKQRQEMRKEKNRKVWVDGVNQRANIKQDEVIEDIISVAGCGVEVVRHDLCNKTLYFEDLKNIPALDISYFTKNNLFARIFELIVFEDIPSSFPYDEEIAVGITLKGTMQIRGASFVPLISNPLSSALAERLNGIDLILDRVTSLDSLDMSINYSKELKEWSIGFATGKGSTVWMLFPPLVMLTPLEKSGAIKLLELFQLIVHELNNFKSDSY